MNLVTEPVEVFSFLANRQSNAENYFAILCAIARIFRILKIPTKQYFKINQSAESATEQRFVFLSYLRHYFLEFKNLRILEPQKWQLKSTDNGQQSTVRGYAVAELVEAPRVVPSTGSGTVHKVCCLLTVVC